MKSFISKTCFLLVICSLIFTCVVAKKDVEPFNKDTITAETVWKRITKDDSYKKWAAWPNHEGMQSGKAPHGPFHIIYINNKIADAIPLDVPTIPDGGIVVKDAFDFDTKISHITVMVKVKDYDPPNGDWFYANYEPKGKITDEGKVNMCISCHVAYKSNDYLIINELVQ